ncbi:MAG: glycosyltransferase [Deltaproteobacteria bacterium]|nr:glycosyltransferase [Deltaproteobacteria bacterium]
MKPKLLVLTSTFPRWAGDREPPFVYELSKRLARWFDIHLLAPHAPGAARMEYMDGMVIRRFPYAPSQWERLAYDGGILSTLKEHRSYYLLVPLFLFFQLLSIIRLIRSENFDCIHAHWLIPQGLLAVIAKAITGSPSPILCTSHGGDMYALRGRLLDKLKQFVIARVDWLTVVSGAMAEQAAALGARPGATNVIPMGVDLKDRFVPPETEREGKQILFVGRLVEKKGVVYLVRAMSDIIREHPDARLVIAGSGPDEVMLREAAVAGGVNDSITFLGPLENKKLPPLYRSSRIVVFPSVVASDGDQEGFGLVQVEALGCRCAVVTTDLPAIRDIITDGETGVVVLQRSESELAEAVIRLLDSPSHCTALGTRGRQVMMKKFDWAVIAEKYRNIIESLL